jgi:phage terminase large subunit GpA-like protein
MAKSQEILRAPGRLTPDEWASRNIILTSGTTSKPGFWKSWPWQVEVVNSVCDPRLSSAVIVWPRQLLGKSSCLGIIIGWSIAQSPANMLIILPSIEAAHVYSKNKLSPLILDCPILKKLVHDDDLRFRRKGAGDTTVGLKRFPGGFLVMASAAASTSLRSHTCKRVFADEASAFPTTVANEEGDPIEIGKMVMETYSDAFMILTSTPAIKGSCRISSEYEDSDQRRWFVSCEACGREFVIQWANVKWNKSKSADGKKTIHDVANAWVECGACGAHHDDDARQRMALDGRWIPTNPTVTNKAGFHSNAFISCLPPYRGYKNRLHQWCSEFLRAERKGTYFLRAFQQNVLSEPYSIESTVSPPFQHLYDRREKYREQDGSIVLPKGVLFLTIGADTHPERIEAEILGTGMDGETFACEYAVFRGNVEATEVWKEFDAWSKQWFRHETGWQLQPVCIAIDAKFKAEAVYRYVRSCAGRRVFAVRGERGFAPLGSAWTTRSTSNNERLWHLKIDGVKESLFSRLMLTEPGPGYQHFPSNPRCGYDLSYFRQLTVETLHTTPSGQQYYAKSSGETRNEATDCRVYALSSAEILKPNFAAIARNLERPPDNDWREKEKAIKDAQSLPIPDFSSTPDSGMEALKNKHPFPKAPSWLKII